jgi:hypothetical protein
VKDSQTSELAVWAMNFSNTDNIPVQISLTGGPTAANSRITKETLQAISGATSLFSVNLPPEQNSGVPRRDVDWIAPVELAGADPTNLQVTLPAATMTLLSVEYTSTSAGDWSLYE